MSRLYVLVSSSTYNYRVRAKRHLHGLLSSGDKTTAFMMRIIPHAKRMNLIIMWLMRLRLLDHDKAQCFLIRRMVVRQ